MIRAGFTLLPLLLSPLTLTAQDLTHDSLSQGGFEKWFSHVVPGEEELQWRKVPWRATFWDAVIEAQDKDRPILLWAMNGHPLACT